MRIFVRNTLQGLIPLYNSDFEKKRKLKLGQDYEADIKRPRNLQFHKKFFALLNIGHQNTKLNMNFEFYRAYVTMKAGYYNAYETERGMMVLPKSISFAAMDDSEFQRLYDAVINVVMLDIDVNKKEIEERIINFI